MSSNWDNFFKVAGLVSAIVVLPTFGWVWSTNEDVQRSSLQIEELEAEVEKMKSNTLNVELMKKDIEYIKSDISEIKGLLKKRSKQ